MGLACQSSDVSFPQKRGWQSTARIVSEPAKSKYKLRQNNNKGIQKQNKEALK